MREIRRAAEEGYDELDGTTYYEAAEITSTHNRFVSRLIELCPPGGVILDAACGTGRYLGLVLEAGRRGFGVDQSAGMLARARERYPDIETQKVGLQELDIDSQFDAVMCIDAMEFVFPEDWPLVMANLRRALRPGGHLYLTVEQVSEQELEKAFSDATAKGLPLVRGENLMRATYHFYPSIPQVTSWVREVGLVAVEDAYSDHGSYGYYHLLAQNPTA